MTANKRTATELEEEVDVELLQEELKKHQENKEKIKRQKRDSYLKHKEKYKKKSSLDVIYKHMENIPESKSKADIANDVDILFKKIQKAVQYQAKKKNYPDFYLPKDKTQFFRHLVHYTNKLHLAAGKPRPSFMDLSLDLILQGLPLRLQKTTRNEYDVYDIHSHNIYKIIASMIKLGSYISVDMLLHQVLNEDNDHFISDSSDDNDDE